MWVLLVIQGVVACVVLAWYGLQSWPNHVMGLLVILPFPALLIAGGLTIRHRERSLNPHREAYLAGNVAEARELKRARIIKWSAIAAVMLAIVVIARSLPRRYEGNAASTWLVAGILLAALLGPILYEAAVRAKIGHGAVRQARGSAPATPQSKRNAVIRFVSLGVFLVAVVAIDQIFHPPVSAFDLFLGGFVVLIAVEFIWRKMNPPRGR